MEQLTTWQLLSLTQHEKAGRWVIDGARNRNQSFCYLTSAEMSMAPATFYLPKRNPQIQAILEGTGLHQSVNPGDLDLWSLLMDIGCLPPDSYYSYVVTDLNRHRLKG